MYVAGANRSWLPLELVAGDTNVFPARPSFSQINIDDRAKHDALLYVEQHEYVSLSLVRKN